MAPKEIISGNQTSHALCARAEKVIDQTKAVPYIGAPLALIKSLTHNGFQKKYPALCLLKLHATCFIECSGTGIAENIIDKKSTNHIYLRFTPNT